MDLTPLLRWLTLPRGWNRLRSKSEKALTDQRTDCHHEDTQESLLLSLPHEIILLIAKHAETSDAACLALCNRASYRLIGAAPFDDMRWGRSRASPSYLQRRSFLLRLSRDRPAWFLSHCCNTLQQTAKVVLPGRMRTAVSCCLQEEMIDWLRSGYSLHFQHIQLVMERHCHGAPYGIAWDPLSKLLVRRSQRYLVTTLTSISARVISDELCLRAQHWISLDRCSLSLLNDDDLEYICRHVSIAIRRKDKASTVYSQRLVECKTQHADRQNGCPTCFPFLRCKICAVEVHFEVKCFGGCKALLWTKWLNLGRGESPSDPRWTSHDSEIPGPVNSRLPLVEVHPQTSLWTAFEGADGKTLADLTEENQTLLSDQSYRGFREHKMLIPFGFRDDRTQD